MLRSAVANAESAHGLDGDELVVLEAYADEGPTLKRWRARARGRVNRIRKRTCHITDRRRGGAEERPRPQAGRSRRLRPRPRPTSEAAAAGEKPKRRVAGEEEGGGRVMGQKVHPGGLRVGVIHDWKSNWWTGKKEIADYILEDIRIREHINGKLSHAGLSDILIRKDKQRITVDIYTARPGIVIGKSGVEVDALRKELHAITGKSVHININEIKRPELDAQLVAQSIAEQLQNRVAFRRAMKRSLASAMRSGAQGIKIQCGGRLGGGEMSRVERYTEGRVPLHTIRADIDYGFAEAKTTYRPDRRQGLGQQGRDHAGGLRGRARSRADHRGRRLASAAWLEHGGPRCLARERPRSRPGPRRARARPAASPPGGGPGGRGQGGRPGGPAVAGAARVVARARDAGAARRRQRRHGLDAPSPETASDVSPATASDVTPATPEGRRRRGRPQGGES